MAKNIEMTFTVGEDGEFDLAIKGIKGAGCKPFHASVSSDLSSLLGIGELSAVDTAEMNAATAERVAPVRVIPTTPGGSN